MKKKRWIILILFFLLTALPPAFADEPHITAEVDERMMQLYTVNLTLDNQYMTSDVPPVLYEYQEQYRTLVPVAAIAVYAGADVSWNEERQEVTITRDDKTILLKINSAAVMVNGEEKTLPSQVPAKIITFQNRGRTMVPVAFIGQELGLSVAWDEAARTVRITTPSTAEPVPVQPVTPGNPPVSSEIQGELLSLSDITIALNGDLPEIRLKTGGKALFSSMRLVSPDRLVFDLHNALLMITDPHKLQSNNTVLVQAIENPYLQSVRSSQFEINPSTVRLVFDMKASADYQMEYDERNDEMVIRLLTDSIDNTNPPVTQTNKLIVIDPGHGGSDPGAIFPLLDLYEKNIVLEVAKQTKSLLEKEGFQVMMTRSDDSYVSLFERVEIANQLQADLFVSIHVNAATQARTKGVETVYYPSEKNPEDFRDNRALAAIFHEEVMKALGADSFRIDARENLIVLRETKMPAVLTELGFVTNPDEERLLASAGYLQSAAEGIFKAVMRYFK
jgi:N-acetylmuramoyl-L-alanine amidase